MRPGEGANSLVDAESWWAVASELSLVHMRAAPLPWLQRPDGWDGSDAVMFV